MTDARMRRDFEAVLRREPTQVLKRQR